MDDIRAGFRFLLENVESGSSDKERHLVSAGLNLLEGMVIDIRRTADALERIADALEGRDAK